MVGLLELKGLKGEGFKEKICATRNDSEIETGCDETSSIVDP